MLNLAQEGDGLAGQLQHSTELFEGVTVLRLLEQLAAVLAAVAADPALPLGDIPLLGAAERHQILVEWNDRAAAYPSGACLPALFAAQAAATPAAVAAVCGGDVLDLRRARPPGRAPRRAPGGGGGRARDRGRPARRARPVIPRRGAGSVEGGRRLSAARPPAPGAAPPAGPGRRAACPGARRRGLPAAAVRGHRRARSGDRHGAARAAAGAACRPGRDAGALGATDASGATGDEPARPRLRALHLRLDRRAQGRPGRAARHGQPSLCQDRRARARRRRRAWRRPPRNASTSRSGSWSWPWWWAAGSTSIPTRWPTTRAGWRPRSSATA